MAKKVSTKDNQATLAEVIMIYSKSTSHCCALIEAKLVEIEGCKFIKGIQVTGKQWHRMERKRTLIPFEHVASIIEFDSEDDLWSEPQAKLIRNAPQEEKQYTPLTSHGQNGDRHSSDQQPPRTGHRNNGRHRNRHRHPQHSRGRSSFRDSNFRDEQSRNEGNFFRNEKEEGQ